MGKTLQIEANDTGGWIAAEIFKKINLVEIEFVADAGKLGQTDLLAFEKIPQKQSQSATLGDEGEAARAYREGGHKGQAEAACGVGQRQTVGADEAHAVVSGQVQDLVGKGYPVLAGFVESAGLDRQSLYPRPAAILDGLGNKSRGNEEYRQIGENGKFRGGPIDADAADIALDAGRVDAEYSPAKTPAQAILDNNARCIPGLGGETVDSK